MKASEYLHVTWEKFAALPHLSHLAEVFTLNSFIKTFKISFSNIIYFYIMCFIRALYKVSILIADF